MKSVLVIDDDRAVLKMITQFLVSEDYQVLTAGNGNEGLKVLESREALDLIITDLLMPGMEGIETIFEIRKRLPDIKIIAMSGGGTMGPEAYLKTASLMGADAAIKKPFLKQQLLDTIDKLF